MTDPIQHLRGLLAKAHTDGPWFVRSNHCGYANIDGPHIAIATGCDTCDNAACYEVDAALIVAAINALPALLEVAEAARAYMKHKFPNGDQSSTVTFSMQMPKLADDLLDAIAKLDEVKP